MRHVIATLILVLFIGAFSQFSTHAYQTSPPNGTCVWVSQTVAAGSPTFSCMDVLALDKLMPKSQQGITGGACSAPNLGVTLYAQDPITKACLPLIPVVSPGFIAKLADPQALLLAEGPKDFGLVMCGVRDNSPDEHYCFPGMAFQPLIGEKMLHSDGTNSERCWWTDTPDLQCYSIGDPVPADSLMVFPAAK